MNLTNVVLETYLPPLFRDRSYDTLKFTEYWNIQGNKLLNAIKLFREFDGNYEIYSSDHLDKIAYLFGFSGDWFWDPSWTIKQKARLFAGVYQSPYIWLHKGEEDVLLYVMNAFDLQPRIGMDTGFIVGQSVVGRDTIGGGEVYEIAYKGPYTQEKEMLVEKIAKVFFPIGISYAIITY